MCKTRKSTLVVASAPSPRPSKSSSSTMPSSSSITFHTSTTFNNSTSFSTESLATLRDSLRETHIIYPFPEILAATNNLLSLSSPSTSCRCSLRGLDALLLHLPLRASPAAVPDRLANLCRSHHTSVPRLLGASLPVDATRIYLAYEYIPGANLSDCLRNPRNPGFTPLSSWISRIQIATDLAQGLEYIHHHSSSSFKIHNRIKSSAVIVTDPGFRAKICHFGAAELSGEIPISSTRKSSGSDEDEEEERRLSNGGGVRIEGTRGYMAPEVLAGGRISQASDVFAFGVVILELLSGEEPLKYRFENWRIEMMSLLETARETYGEEEDGGVEGRQGRIRQWMDRRLRDSFPVEVAEKLIRVALRCVDVKPGARPDMVWVAGKVSRMFLDSVAWEERVGAAPNFSVSLAPR